MIDCSILFTVEMLISSNLISEKAISEEIQHRMRLFDLSNEFLQLLLNCGTDQGKYLEL